MVSMTTLGPYLEERKGKAESVKNLETAWQK